MPIEERLKLLSEKSEQYERDIGFSLRGEFDQISKDTYRDLANAVKDHMEGVNRVEIPVNDRVSIEGKREGDGRISVGIKIKF